MQLGQVECFVAVADALSYRRAAATLHFSRSHVSQQITQLEAELSVRLFERSTHHVELTAAGRRLLPQARDLLRSHAELLSAARVVASADRPRLSVAYSSGSWDAAARSIKAFSARHPEVDVTTVQRNTEDLAEHIRDGSSDVAFALSTHDLAAGLSCAALYDFAQNYLAVAADHHLAGLEQLTVEDLRDHRLLLPSTDVDRGHGHRILAFLQQRNIHTDYRFHHFTSEEEVVDIVSAGLGVVFVGETTFHRWGGWREICIRPIVGEVPHLSQLMIWHHARGGAMTAPFVEIASATFGTPGAGSEADPDASP